MNKLIGVNLVLVILVWSSPPVKGFSLTNLVNSFTNKEKIFEVGKLINNKTKAEWNKITTNELKNLDLEQLTSLFNYDRGVIPKRIRKDIERLMMDESMTAAQIRQKLSNRNIGRGDIQQIIRILPRPDKFTKQNITNIGQNNIDKLGFRFLLKIRDPEAIKELKRIIQNNLDIGTEERKERFRALKKLFFMHTGLKPEQWTNETFKDIDFKGVTTNMVERMKPEVLVSKKNDMIGAVSRLDEKIPKNKNLRRAVLKKLLEAENMMKEKDHLKVLVFIGKLGNMKRDLLPEDFTDESIRNHIDIKPILDDNVKTQIQNKMISPKTAKIEAKKMVKEKVNITKQYINEKGIESLAIAPPGFLKNAIKNEAITESNVIDIANSLQNIGGPAADNKRKTLARLADKYFKDITNPTIQNYPSEITSELLPSNLIKVTQSVARSTIERKDSMQIDGTKTGVLLDKVKSSYENINKRAKSQISSSSMANKNVQEALSNSKNLPPVTTMVKILAEKTFKDIDEIDKNVINIKQVNELNAMGVADASKFNFQDILLTLPKLKEKGANPTMGASTVLKNKLYKYFKDNLGATDTNDVMKRMTIGDVEATPVSVIAAFGANALYNLGDDQKISLMEQLGKLENTDYSVTREARIAINTNGMEALRQGGPINGIEPGDFEMLGKDVVFSIPGKYISAASESIIPYIIEKAQKRIKMKGMMPCLDSDQRRAIGELLLKFQVTDPSEWENTDEISCLLPFLSLSDLNKIQPEVLSMSKCDLFSIPIEEEIFEALCKESIGESEYENMEKDYEKFEELKIDAAVQVYDDIENPESSRKKRDTNTKLDPCTKVLYGGANVFTDEELEKDVIFDEIKMCLADFGARDMESGKADILARKIMVGLDNDLKSLNASMIIAIGYILKGFSSSDLDSFPTFNYKSYNDVIARFGRDNMFEEAQTKALAEKFQTDWRRPSEMTSVDLQLVKYILCGFNGRDIENILTSIFKEAVPFLKDVLKECKIDPVLISFARLSKRAYNSELKTWTRVEVSELGPIIAGMVPEDFDDFPSDCFAGMTPSTAEKLDIDNLRALNEDDIRFLSTAAASSIPKEQYEKLTPEIQTAIQDVMGSSQKFTGTIGKGGTSTLSINIALLLMLLSTAIFMTRVQNP